MSTTISYKGSTIATADNQTKTLKTAGKYMEADVIITDVTSSQGSAAVTVIDSLDQAGGVIRQIIAVDISQDTVTAATLKTGVTAHDRFGNAIVGEYDGGGGAPNLQSTSVTYTPTESVQATTVTAASGYDGLSQVGITVNAIASTYVGSSIVRRSSSDLIIYGRDVTAPAGYYATSVMGSIPWGNDGYPVATKGTVSNHSITITPSVTNTEGYIEGGTLNGTAVTVSASQLVSGTKSITSNGTNIDVTNYAAVDISVSGGGASLQTTAVNFTPTENQQSSSLTPGSGYDGFSQVSVTVGAVSTAYVGSGIARRSSSNLSVSGATITAPAGYYASQASTSVASGTAGTPTASKGTVSNHSITVTPSVTNTTGYITGGTKTGTGVSVSASELVSGTYSVTSSGNKDVTNYATASVPAGTEGTPTASKGTVSNHSISVTPSVTNTSGYITGGTKTGTAVSVSASQLVSGSETKTTNGTYNVTNLASLIVAVPIVTYYTGTSDPSSSTGSNNDIYLKTAS